MVGSVINYTDISQKINRLHPVQAKKFTSILNAVQQLLESGQRPIYRKITALTGCSSRTISKFWRWLKAQGVDLSQIFKSRVEEVGVAIENLKRKGFKPTYRRIREVMKCSYSTISKFFRKFGRRGKTTASKQVKPLSYSKAAGLFRKLSQAEQERYFRRARDVAGDQSSSPIEKVAITIFARSQKAADMAASPEPKSSLFKKIIRQTKAVGIDPQIEARILEAFNVELEARNLIPFGSLTRKDKGYLRKILDQGHSLDDILQVIKFKADEWLKEAKMIPSFRPQTIFKPSKFHMYLNQTRTLNQKKTPQVKVLKAGTQVEYRGQILNVEEDGELVFLDKRKVHVIPPQNLWRMIQAGEVKIIKEDR